MLADTDRGDGCDGLKLLIVILSADQIDDLMRMPTSYLSWLWYIEYVKNDTGVTLKGTIFIISKPVVHTLRRGCPLPF